MSTAPWEPQPSGEGLVAPQRRQAKRSATTSMHVDSVRSAGPRLRLQLRDFSAPALSSAPVAAAPTQAPAESAKPSLLARLATHGIVAELRRYFGAALQVVLFRNFALLLQPQVLLQPKMALAGLGAVIMTAATMIVSGEREAKVSDQFGAAPPWTPPTIAAPDWNTVAQPVSTAPATSDTNNTVASDSTAPAWTPPAAPPVADTALPAAAPNFPTAPGTGGDATGTVPAASANGQATAPRGPEAVAARPEAPRPYPATFAPEAPPQARITGNITVLPGEATP